MCVSFLTLYLGTVFQEIDEEYQGRLGRHRDLMQYLIEELGSEIEYVYEYKDKDTTKTCK